LVAAKVFLRSTFFIAGGLGNFIEHGFDYAGQLDEPRRFLLGLIWPLKKQG